MSSHPVVNFLNEHGLDEGLKKLEEMGIVYKQQGSIIIFKYLPKYRNGEYLIRKSRGLILDTSNNQINVICSSIEGGIHLEKFRKIVNINDCIIEENIEGTLINLYYYNNRWNVSTKFCINADETRFRNKKTFRQSFDKLVNINTLDLDVNFTYSFILVLKENKLVTKVKRDMVYHIETTNNITDDKIFVDLGIPHPRLLFLNKKEKLIQYSKIIEKLIEVDWDKKGFMLFSKDRKYRCSVINPRYEYVKNLVSNQANLKYLCLESKYYKKNDSELLIFFPEYEPMFCKITNDLYDLIDSIYKIYVDVKCLKIKEDIPKKFYKIIYNIHNLYKHEKSSGNLNFKVNKKFVKSIILDEDCPYVYSLIYK